MGAVRHILSRYVGLAAEDLCFSYGLKGKPELAGTPETSGIKFDLSHSSEFALLAVTQGLTVVAEGRSYSMDYISWRPIVPARSWK